MCGTGAQGDASHAWLVKRTALPAASLWYVLQAVTFKWLARRFSVPVNEAKQMLFAFAEKHRYPACSGKGQAGDSLQAERTPCSTVHSMHREPHAPEQPRTCLAAVMMFTACHSSGSRSGSAPHWWPLVHAGPR